MNLNISKRLINLTEIKLREWLFNLPIAPRRVILRNLKSVLIMLYSNSQDPGLLRYVNSLHGRARGPFDLAQATAPIVPMALNYNEQFLDPDIDTATFNRFIDQWIKTIDDKLNEYMENKNGG